MIAADTSVLINYFKGINNAQTQKVHEALNYHALVFPPVVLSELLSDSTLPQEFIDHLLEIPTLALKKHYWARAGRNRAILIHKKLKARLADTLIAQSCIDHNVPLITANGDFKHFNQYCGLKLG